MARKLKRKKRKKVSINKKPQQKSKKISDQGFSIPKTRYVEGIGRRKVATARVRIYEKEGDFIVNNMPVGKYFASIPHASIQYNKPFQITDTKGKFAVTVRVQGSGKKAQIEAVMHGLARALVKKSEDFRPKLKEAGLLTRDPRMKETRKVGRGGKARRKRQSPKR